MSDDVKHGDDELELDTQEVQDTEADDVSTDDAKSTEENSDDSSASLDLEEGNGSQVDDKKAAAKQVQVKALAAKILTGELTYEKFPAAQKWLLSDVMDMVSKAQGRPKAADEGEVSKLVQKELEKEKFSTRLAEVKAASLSKAENLAITERFKFLRAKGFSQLEALEDALTFHRIDLAKAKPRQPVMKEGGNGKNQNQQRKVEDVDIDEINSMSPRQLAALNGQKVA